MCRLTRSDSCQNDDGQQRNLTTRIALNLALDAFTTNDATALVACHLGW